MVLRHPHLSKPLAHRRHHRAAIALQGGLTGVNGDEWVKVVYGLVISTFLGFGTGWLFTRLIKKLCCRASRAKANSFFKWAQIISGAGVAVLHGRRRQNVHVVVHAGYHGSA